MAHWNWNRGPETPNYLDGKIVVMLWKDYGDTRKRLIRRAIGDECGICGRQAKRMALDHCHDSGVIRGVLCVQCNTSLGVLGDNMAGLDRARAYLGRPPPVLAGDDARLMEPTRGDNVRRLRNREFYRWADGLCRTDRA